MVKLLENSKKLLFKLIFIKFACIIFFGLYWTTSCFHFVRKVKVLTAISCCSWFKQLKSDIDYETSLCLYKKYLLTYWYSLKKYQIRLMLCMIIMIWSDFSIPIVSSIPSTSHTTLLQCIPHTQSVDVNIPGVCSGYTEVIS